MTRLGTRKSGDAPLTPSYSQVLSLDGNPLIAVESGVLQEGAKGLVDYLVYNHAYDLKDKNILPPRAEQRLQVNSKNPHLQPLKQEA